MFETMLISISMVVTMSMSSTVCIANRRTKCITISGPFDRAYGKAICRYESAVGGVMDGCIATSVIMHACISMFLLIVSSFSVSTFIS